MTLTAEARDRKAKLDQFRSQARDGTMTLDDLRQAIALLREGRAAARQLAERSARAPKLRRIAFADPEVPLR